MDDPIQQVDLYQQLRSEYDRGQTIMGPYTWQQMRQALDSGLLFTSAIFCECQRTVEILLAHGVDVNKRDYHGCYPLHAAVRLNNLTMIKVLVDHGADVNQIDEQGRNALHLAIEYGLSESVVKEIIQYLIACKVVVVKADTEGRNALHYVAKRINPELMEILLDNGAKPNFVDNHGKTPLHLMIEYCHLTMIESMMRCFILLLDHECNVNCQDYYGHTPLHYVSRQYNREELVDFARLLIGGGGGVNMETYEGETAFMFASDNGLVIGELARTIGIFMIKIDVAGLRANTRDLQIIRQAWLNNPANFNGINLITYEENLTTELKAIQDCKIYNSLSLYDILVTLDLCYRKSDELVESLKSVDYDEFPEFGHLLRRKVAIDEMRFNYISRQCGLSVFDLWP